MAEKAKKKKATEPKATTPWGKAMLSDFDEAAPWNDPALRPPKPKPTPKFVPAPTTETEPFVSGPDRAFSRADEIRRNKEWLSNTLIPRKKKNRPSAEEQKKAMEK